MVERCQQPVTLLMKMLPQVTVIIRICFFYYVLHTSAVAYVPRRHLFFFVMMTLSLCLAYHLIWCYLNCNIKQSLFIVRMLQTNFLSTVFVRIVAYLCWPLWKDYLIVMM